MTVLLEAHKLLNGALKKEALVIIAYAVGCLAVGVGAIHYTRTAVRNARYEVAKKISRDLRLFRDNRCGQMPDSAMFALLSETSYIAQYHATDADAPVEGVSRMETRDQPRSHAGRRQAQRREVRNRGKYEPVMPVKAGQEGTVVVRSTWFGIDDNPPGGRF